MLQLVVELESFPHALMTWQIINIYKFGFVLDVCQSSLSFRSHITVHNLIYLFFG